MTHSNTGGEKPDLLRELANAKCMFQMKAIVAAMQIPLNETVKEKTGYENN